ncbi:MAG: hypothetical protein CM15mP25_2380 [Gammaproteobacteria bacterium]|nr:MAG: hypothetical protein CM15mP25_2380 [Gammaproteobacteria bacterium]
MAPLSKSRPARGDRRYTIADEGSVLSGFGWTNNYLKKRSLGRLRGGRRGTQRQAFARIGTGTTAECFIRLLPQLKSRIEATVASSGRSAALLSELGLPVVRSQQCRSSGRLHRRRKEANSSCIL